MSRLELSMAITAHLAWKTKVRAAMRSGDFKEVCLDGHACQLGRWLDAGDTKGVYKDLYALHGEVHKLCARLADDPKSEKRLREWDAASDRLLEMLQQHKMSTL